MIQYCILCERIRWDKNQQWSLAHIDNLSKDQQKAMIFAPFCDKCSDVEIKIRFQTRRYQAHEYVIAKDKKVPPIDPPLVSGIIVSPISTLPKKKFLSSRRRDVNLSDREKQIFLWCGVCRKAARTTHGGKWLYYQHYAELNHKSEQASMFGLEIKESLCDSCERKGLKKESKSA